MMRATIPIFLHIIEMPMQIVPDNVTEAAIQHQKEKIVKGGHHVPLNLGLSVGKPISSSSFLEALTTSSLPPYQHPTTTMSGLRILVPVKRVIDYAVRPSIPSIPHLHSHAIP